MTFDRPTIKSIAAFMAFFTMIDWMFGLDFGLVGNVVFGFGCGLCWGAWKPLWRGWIGEP